MTGRELILYILENHLEDEPVCKDGTFIGFIPISDAAAKIEAGPATILALVKQNQLDYVVIGGRHFVSDIDITKLEKKGV